MRSPLLDVDDALERDEPEDDEDVATAVEVGPPPLRMRDYRAQTAAGLRQPGTTVPVRERRPTSADGTPVRSPWETLPREGATAAQEQRFATGEAAASHKVRGVARDFEGIRG